MSDREPVKVNESPRISAPKLGEYMTIPRAHRREAILRDQKIKSTFKAIRYAEADNMIRSALLAGGDVAVRLLERASVLSGRPGLTQYRKESTESSVQAARQFARLYPKIDLAGYTLSGIGARSLGISIEGVWVSAKPSVLLSRAIKGGKVDVGALLLVYSKSIVLDIHGCQAIAEVLRRALVAAGYENVRPELCRVVEVFTGKIADAPARSARLTSEIESTCREIAVRWPSIAAA